MRTAEFSFRLLIEDHVWEKARTSRDYRQFVSQSFKGEKALDHPPASRQQLAGVAAGRCRAHRPARQKPRARTSPARLGDFPNPRSARAPAERQPSRPKRLRINMRSCLLRTSCSRRPVTACIRRMTRPSRHAVVAHIHTRLARMQAACSASRRLEIVGCGPQPGTVSSETRHSLNRRVGHGLQRRTKNDTLFAPEGSVAPGLAGARHPTTSSTRPRMITRRPLRV